VSAKPVGTVVRLEHFGIGDAAQYDISAGPKVPACLEPWIRLPPAPPGDDGETILARWQREARGLLWSAAEGEAEEAARAAREEVRGWLEEPAGQAWFERLAVSSRQDGPARAWLSALRAAGWCRCYPDLTETGEPVWPKGVSLVQPGVEFVYDDGPGPRMVRVARFATEPSRARCTVALKQPTEGTPLRAALDLEPAVAAVPGVAPLLQGLVGAEREAYARGSPVADPVKALRPVLEGFAQAAPKVAPAQADALLDGLRRYAATHKLEILPRHWSRGAVLRREDLAADETEGAVVFFDARPAGEVVAVVRLGLSGQGVREQSGVRISGGPAPEGYPELVKLAAAGGAPAADFLTKLRSWPASRLEAEDHLDIEAVDLFVAFHDPAGDPWRAADPGAAQAFGQAIGRILESAFGLVLFSPRSMQEHPPSWLDVRNSDAVVSGRVRRVLRPGLKYPDGRLRIPAIVTLE
jgi:hypothetical protein